LTKEKAKKEQAIKKDEPSEKRRKKEKSAGYKKEKSAVERLSRGVSAEPMSK